MRYIFVDASYYIFFRFHALKNWWSLAKRDEPVIPNESEEFKEKFRKTFKEKMKEMAKKVGIPKGTPYRLFVGKDCPRSDIWRTPLFDQYKCGRADSSMEGHFFGLTYEEGLFEDVCGDNCILEHPSLEADDVIALSVRNILSRDKDAICYVITSDMDYLQLATCDRVKLYDLKYKLLTEKSKYYQETGRPDKDLFIKCVCGDKSDNIPSAFPKCGKKTAEKMWELTEEERMKTLESKHGLAQYQHNKRLIDFENIPSELRDEFLSNHSSKWVSCSVP
jgi:5'-3' exonuclease